MESLPSYNDSNEAAGAAPKPHEDLLPPTTLYVAGRFIHSADPTAPPLYELSHSVGFLKDTDRNVRVERLDYSVKNPASVAQVATRKRHIYDLKHPTVATGPTFEYHAEPTSRQSLCTFGLVSFRPKRLSSVKGYRVHRATHSLDHHLACRELIFSAVPARDKAVRFEWSDGQDQLVARELDRNSLMTLIISAGMGAGKRDALVSAWMSRVWWELAKAQATSR